MSRDPVEGDSDPPCTQGVEGALDSTGFDPVHVSAGGVGGARVNGILTVREDGVAGWGGFLAWREGDTADAVGEPLGAGVGSVVVGWEVFGGFEDHPCRCGDGSDLSADVCDQDSGLGAVGLHRRETICGADHSYSSSSLGGRKGAGGAVRDDDHVPLGDGFCDPICRVGEGHLRLGCRACGG